MGKGAMYLSLPVCVGARTNQNAEEVLAAVLLHLGSSPSVR